MNSLRLIFVCTSTACALILTTRHAAAVDPSPEAAATATTGAGPQPPPISFRILEQRQIHGGDRTVFLNRVAPPILPQAPAPIAPVLSPEAQKELQARAQKPHLTILLGATVYDHRMTELHWSSEGKSFIAWSNIDFNDITGTGEFETPEMVCSLIVAIGNESSEFFAETNRNILARNLHESLVKTIPAAEQFPQDRSIYFFAGDNGAESCDPKTLAALDALHVYYDAHREELHRAFREREAKRIETERWQKEHPPVKKDTVIHYWPIKSSVYPVTGGTQP